MDEVERDILAAAGSVRMFLVAAYAGEKDKLNEVSVLCEDRSWPQMKLQNVYTGSKISG